MRILLDECVDAGLRHELPGHDVQTVAYAGLAGVKNGRLLRQVADSGRFDVFLTMDKNLPQQQQLKVLPFAIVVLRAVSNNIESVRPRLPEILRRLPEFKPGRVYVLRATA
jgi:predicted nuclease of predicted toxin-antitoxin system